MKVRKAVIPAAGLGTRFLPATKAVPKEMIPLLDKPVIQYVIEEAVASGIKEILIITGRGKEAIENHFDISYELENIIEKKERKELLQLIQPLSYMANIYFIRQRMPKGLGHAISCAKDFICDEPFAVLLGDDIFHCSEKPCIKQLIEQYEKNEASIFALLNVAREYVDRYGIISGYKVNKNLYDINDLVEKPSINEAPSNLAIMGRYIFTPKIFEMIEMTIPGKDGEIQLTDAMKKLITFEKIYGYIFNGKRYDTGYLIGYLEAVVDFALRREDIKDDFFAFLKEKL